MAAKDKYGQRLRQLRELAGVSQAQVAHFAGLHREHWCMIEKGYRSITDGEAAKVENYLRRIASKRVAEIQSVMESPVLATA